jgi:nucleotide-binding universal stress UspA family protein
MACHPVETTFGGGGRLLSIKRVLCPIDFSDISRVAVHYAAALARRYGASIIALHVVPPPVVPVLPGPEPILYPPLVYSAEDIERFTIETLKFVHPEVGPGIEVDANVVLGSVADEIVEHAKSLPADFVVIGTHGRSGFERLMLGSVAERVVRKAPSPVLTAPPRAPDAQPIAPIRFTRILCAVDFSPASIKALQYAASIVDEPGSDVIVLHVLELPPIYEPVEVGGPGLAEFEVHARKSAERRLHELVTEHIETKAYVTELVTTGRANREILSLAEERRVELISIGVHGGAGGILAFGSTASNVVRAATCPVLSLKA